MMLKELPQVKKRDEDSISVQSFFTHDERTKIKEVCDHMGYDASHFIRCLVMGYLAGKNQEENREGT